jgi:uracil-DNA glycosylase
MNIFQELQSDGRIPARPAHGELTSWADQGVFLLNTCLSVRAGQAASHQGRGWETFTDSVILELNARREGLVFLLWGAPAGRKAAMIDARRHLILTAPHPSPLSAHRGFLGCRHFSATDAHLATRGEAPIDWRLPP